MSVDLRVQIAPGGSPTVDPDTLTWLDITDRARAKIKITRGRQDEQSQTSPARCDLRLNNADGHFVSSNPIGPYHGLLARNCPIRVSINIGGTWYDRFTGYVDAWPIKWAPGETDCYVDVTASGIMRRLTQGTPPSRGALYRYIRESQDFARLAYWPLEDGSDSKSAASADDQAGPMTFSAVQFGATAPLSGVTTLCNPQGGFGRGALPQYFANDWRVEYVVVYDAVPATNVRILSWLTPGSPNAWNLRCDSSGFHLDGYLQVSPTSSVLTLNVDSGSIPVPGQVHHLRCDIRMNGTTLEARLYVDGVQVGSTDTIAATLTLPPTYIRINPDSATTDVPNGGHLGIWAGNPVTESHDAARGWVGQRAHRRIEAMCAAEDIPLSPVLGATVSSEAMGPQPLGSRMQVLRDCGAADGGILYELTSGPLTYLRREDRYNQTVALAASYTQLAPPLEPVDDDQLLANDVTVRRPGGSDARHVNETHVAAEGRYEDSADVNTQFDARLLDHAAWRVRMGTVDELRYPTIVLNFLGGATPLIAQWLACDIGSRLSVDDLPAELPPDPLDLILEGYTETLDAVEWTATLNCSPAAPFQVAVWGTSRWDTAGSTLGTATLSAKADGNSATADVITVADAAAVGFAVGNQCVLHDVNGYRKEPTVFTITAMASGFGFTNINFSPDAETPPVGTFGGTGDTIRRVDQTSLSVSVTTGPLWRTGVVNFDIDAAGEQMTVTNVSGATSPQTFTVTRSVNGVQKAHPAGTAIKLSSPGRWAL